MSDLERNTTFPMSHLASTEVDVKQDAAVTDAQAVESFVPDWTDEEERAAQRKFDIYVLPLLMLGFFSQQIDRGNIGPALTSGMTKDIGINQNIINNGQTILYIMIVITELPSNLLLQRIGAKYWIPCQMIVWGIVAACHSEIKEKAGFYVCRIALGLTEAGFIPGSIYYMSTFYTKTQFASRAGLFWIGSYTGKACGGLFAAGLFRLDGKAGRHGWQWLFLVEGCISVFIGLVALIMWPRSTEDTRTLIPGFRLLTRRQEHIVTSRLLLDDPAKNRGHRMKIDFKDVARAFAAWRLWIILLFNLSLVAALTCLETYNSQITTSLGFSTIKGNALASVGVWCCIPLIVLSGKVVQWSGKRGLTAFCFLVPYPILTGVFRHLQEVNGPIWTKYGVYQTMVAFGVSPYILGVVWMTSNTRTPTQRSVYSALYVMTTNVANSFATQMFRASDKPKYLKGLIGVISFQCVAGLSLLAALLAFWLSNKYSWGDAGLPAITADLEIEEEGDVERVAVTKQFKYAL